MSDSCSLDEMYDYFEGKDEEYSKNTVLYESLDQELQSIGADIVNVLRSNNKPANDVVLLSKHQAQSIEELKKNSEEYLRAYTELVELTKKKKNINEKETAEAMKAEVKRLVCHGKKRFEFTEQLYYALQNEATTDSLDEKNKEPVDVSPHGRLDSD